MTGEPYRPGPRDASLDAVLLSLTRQLRVTGLVLIAIGVILGAVGLKTELQAHACIGPLFPAALLSFALPGWVMFRTRRLAGASALIIGILLLLVALLATAVRYAHSFKVDAIVMGTMGSCLPGGTYCIALGLASSSYPANTPVSRFFSSTARGMSAVCVMLTAIFSLIWLCD
jgi:hypothetical protein